mmetsp:Transcript_108269/g.345776  ORF Transcript_108269/g.345776 Transcript_108269/m.345776 type:complete len:496 (-) Transcript_108269:85-1572(-)|eukprot:CAMPEP_0203865814 /NCGR_PEP_ID=MMETSP0359-20131031/15572_1 /ASSEMBLY_ACC=CAM_ASM_000338 /TAXON_ID=268821 /ORGANISM="Scrippsiella Hangoei, Strain SHTV-5" /LENGTH=495 /DNA_ID=CAMNT_0050783789 /DNA_START=70 /DNA_END=1557 /DNA_ORIENTATION=+
MAAATVPPPTDTLFLDALEEPLDAVTSCNWRGQLLARCAERDRRSDGLKELYDQYNDNLRSLKLLSFAHASPLLGPQETTRADGADDMQLSPANGGGATPGGSSSTRGSQELEAMRQVLEEREQELREKDAAHADVCRQATQLGRENRDLKEQLQAKTEEAERLLSELSMLRESEACWQGGGGRRVAAALVQPLKRRVFNKIHDAELTCIAAASSQVAPLPRSLIAIGTADGFVKLVNGETGRAHAQIKVSLEQPRLVAVDLAPGTGMLLAASSDHALRLLDLRAQKLLHTLRGHTDRLSACGFLKGNTHAFTASFDGTVKIWDLEKGQTHRSIRSAKPVCCAALHQSSGIIVAGHQDGTVAVWDPRSSDAFSVPVPVHQGRGLVGLCMAPDGQSILSQADDGVVCVTSLDAMRTTLTLRGAGPVAWPSQPVFSQDGAFVLARGVDSIHCWDATTGELVCSHDKQAPLCVCWELPQAVSAHSNGHAALWGTEGGA